MTDCYNGHTIQRFQFSFRQKLKEFCSGKPHRYEDSATAGRVIHLKLIYEFDLETSMRKQTENDQMNGFSASVALLKDKVLPGEARILSIQTSSLKNSLRRCSELLSHVLWNMDMSIVK